MVPVMRVINNIYVLSPRVEMVDYNNITDYHWIMTIQL